MTSPIFVAIDIPDLSAAKSLAASVAGQPTLIPPGVTNLVGAVIGLDAIPDAFLYTIRTVDPEVMRSMRLMEENTAEYKSLEAGRTSLQIAFGVLYLGFALIVLLAAIWTAIAVADTATITLSFRPWTNSALPSSFTYEASE